MPSADADRVAESVGAAEPTDVAELTRGRSGSSLDVLGTVPELARTEPGAGSDAVSSVWDAATEARHRAAPRKYSRRRPGPRRPGARCPSLGAPGQQAPAVHAQVPPAGRSLNDAPRWRRPGRGSGDVDALTAESTRPGRAARGDLELHAGQRSRHHAHRERVHLDPFHALTLGGSASSCAPLVVRPACSRRPA